jgi:hypothetical protein
MKKTPLIQKQGYDPNATDYSNPSGISQRPEAGSGEIDVLRFCVSRNIADACNNKR